jgi:putative membrane protein
MLVKKRYSAKEMIKWTKTDIILFAVQAAIITGLYSLLGLTFLHIPWTPIALIGTALAFMIGFQNNAAYDRIWEARKIWGAITNSSRTWGMKIHDMITNEYAKTPVTEAELDAFKKSFVHRHIAWLTALRHAMRQPRSWEHAMEHKENKKFSEILHIPEQITSMEDDLMPYLSREEMEFVLTKNNKASAILNLQSGHLRELKEKGLIWEFSFLELGNLIQNLFVHQGKSERIKNFPYPRQYATLSHNFVWIFIILFPFGIIPEFAQIGEALKPDFPLFAPYFIWLAVPFCTVVSWVFHTMKRIGIVGENPFEGTSNDVPISTIARGIEIDLRQMLGEDDATIPGQFPQEYAVQM